MSSTSFSFLLKLLGVLGEVGCKASSLYALADWVALLYDVKALCLLCCLAARLFSKQFQIFISSSPFYRFTHARSLFSRLRLGTIVQFNRGKQRAQKTQLFYHYFRFYWFPSLLSVIPLDMMKSHSLSPPPSGHCLTGLWFLLQWQCSVDEKRPPRLLLCVTFRTRKKGSKAGPQTRFNALLIFIVIRHKEWN